MRRLLSGAFFLLCALLLAPAAPWARGPGTAPRWSASDPPIDYAHIADGAINRRGYAVGYHHRANGIDPPGARVLRIIQPPNAAGIYRARVAIRDSATGEWVAKKAPSTFFPDAMSERAVIAAILHAFRDGRRRADGRFIGPSGRGFAVEGWFEHGRIVSAYPLRGR